MRVAINATSAKMGGAATYLFNLLPQLVRQLEGDRESSIVVWTGPDVGRLSGLHRRVEVRTHEGAANGGLRRLLFDQLELPSALRRGAFDVLFSSANLGPLRSPCRQVLLVRNPIYFSPEYERRMVNRRVKLRLRFQRWLTLRAIEGADHVLFPTRAMMTMVASYIPGPRANWSVAPYGARHDLFSPSPSGDEGRARTATVRLLHVSHYCDQKNLGTLLHALALLDQRHPGKYHLTLTAGLEGLRDQSNPHCPSLPEDRRLLRRLDSRGVVTDLGAVSYEALPERYRRADLFVFPSYTESFGHPLVEAMASGLPVVAADVPVNREMCGDAAAFFPTFDSPALAELIEGLTTRRAGLGAMCESGLVRSAEFTWERHAAQLVAALRGREQLEPAPGFARGQALRR